MTDNELLARIDEKVTATHDDVKEIKEHLKTMDIIIAGHETRMCLVEKQCNDSRSYIIWLTSAVVTVAGTVGYLFLIHVFG